MGALSTDFGNLMRRLETSLPSTSAPVASKRLKNVLEELFRYIYLAADSLVDGTIQTSPSGPIKKAVDCLLLDPVLYFHVCDAILTMHGKGNITVRVLPYNAEEDQNADDVARMGRYFHTVDRYTQVFSQDPPADLWNDYTNNVIKRTVTLPVCFPSTHAYVPQAPAVTPVPVRQVAAPASAPASTSTSSIAPSIPPVVSPAQRAVAAPTPVARTPRAVPSIGTADGPAPVGTLWTYVIRLAVSNNDMTMYQSQQILKCWSGANEKHERFVQLVEGEFGSIRGKQFIESVRLILFYIVYFLYPIIS